MYNSAGSAGFLTPNWHFDNNEMKPPGFGPLVRQRPVGVFQQLLDDGAVDGLIGFVKLGKDRAAAGDQVADGKRGMWHRIFVWGKATLAKPKHS